MKTYEQAPYRLTKKQMNVLEKIVVGPGGGELIDVDQLLDLIDYETTRPSIRFTLKGLLTRKMIVKKGKELRRERMRMVYAPTMLGVNTLGGVIVEGLEDVESADGDR